MARDSLYHSPRNVRDHVRGKDHLFEPLQRLFKGDQAKIHHALRILEKVLQEDMERLGGARSDCDWIAVARLAHRIKSGCMQIGRHGAAAALLALEETAQVGASGDGCRDREFNAANEEIRKLLTDIDGYLKREGG